MAYPSGVSLAIINAGNAFTAFGDDVSLTVSVAPKFPKVGGGFLTRVVHAPSGWVMTDDTQEFKSEAGAELSFSAPHVDQPGFRDPAQNAYTGWYYEVRVSVGNPRGKTRTTYTQNVQPFTGQALIDLDLVPDGPVGEAASAPVPAVLSVNGLTGNVIVGDGGAIDISGTAKTPTLLLASDTLSALESGRYRVEAVDVATTLGLPSPGHGLLDVLQQVNSGLMVWRPIVTPAQEWFNTTLDNGATWSGWERTTPDVSGFATKTYADQAEADAVAASKTYTDENAVAVTDPRLPSVEDNDYAYGWADADGRVALGVTNTGDVTVPGAVVEAVGDDTGYSWGVADQDGRVSLGVRVTGEVELEGKSLTELVGESAPKLSPLVLTLAGGGAPSGTDTRSAVHVRLPFSPTVDVTVKAVHIRNYNDRSTLPYTGALSFAGVWIGPHKVDHTGLTGQFTTNPTQVSGAFTTGAGGEEHVITGLNIPLGRNTEHLLSFGYTCADGQTNHRGVGGCWTTTTPADAGVIAPASMTREALAPLDVWLEIEHTAPVIAWLGDSIACGVGNTTPVYTAPGTLHARANGLVPMLYCHSGSAMTNWTGGNTLWKYAKWNPMTRPDAVVWEIGRNDLITATDVATMRTRFNDLYPRVADYISRNIYMTTITPKADDETSTDGAVRRAWNDVIRNELQAEAVRMAFDVAKSTESDGGTSMRAELDSGDALHFNKRGSVVIAQTINQPLV